MKWKRRKRRAALGNHTSDRGRGIVRKQRDLAKDTQWQAMERAVDEHITRGELMTFEDSQASLAWLEKELETCPRMRIMIDPSQLTRAAFEHARVRLLRDVEFHQQTCSQWCVEKSGWHEEHVSCWCGEKHDLFEADDLNDALEEEALTKDPEGRALWERFERPPEAPTE